MRKPAIQWLVKITGSAAILILLFTQIDFDRKHFFEALKSVRFEYYLFSLIGVIITIGVKSYRWKLLLKDEGCNYPLKNAFQSYFASYTIGIVTPGRIGEIARLYYVRQHADISLYKAFTTLVSDRFFDLSLMIWFGLSGILFYYKSLGDFSAPLYTLIIAGVMLLGFLILKTAFGWARKRTKLGHAAIIQLITDVLTAVGSLKSVKKWLLSGFAYFVFFGTCYYIFKSLSISISLIDVAFVLSFMSLSTILPISFAGFGTREVSLIFLLKFYQIPPEIAVTFSLLQFTAFFLWGGIIGMLFWMLNPIPLKRVKEDTVDLMKLLFGKIKS